MAGEHCEKRANTMTMIRQAGNVKMQRAQALDNVLTYMHLSEQIDDFKWLEDLGRRDVISFWKLNTGAAKIRAW